MPESGQEFSGKSVDEAVAEGLAQLGLRQDQVEIEILSRGSRGIFGLGSEPARVRISRAGAPAPAVKPAPPAAKPPAPEPAAEQPAAPKPLPPIETPPAPPRPSSRPAPIDAHEEEEDIPLVRGEAIAMSEQELQTLAADLLRETVKRMGFDASVDATWHDADEDNDERYLVLNIHGHDVSPLIGRRGETLASLQYLVRLMINQRVKQWMNIIVDVEQYKERRVNQLTQLALRMADQVAQTGRAVSLEPMPPNERRVVHLALRDHPTVYTQSSGDGERRKVHIVARG